MKRNLSMNQPCIRAKIVGIILILMGAGFLFNPTSLNIKIGFASMLIGIFWVILITEKSIPKKISDNQIEGNIDVVKKIIRQLNLDGNAVFLSRSDILTEERILIPPNKTGIIKIPNIDNNHVFLTGSDGKNLGISLPPSGLKLLKEIEKDGNFEDIGIENVEEKLQKFVGMNLLKSVSFKKQLNGWKLELKQPIFCPNDQNLCKQYPCPVCSAILTAITRASKKKIRIKDTKIEGGKITFHLNVIKGELNRGNENC